MSIASCSASNRKQTSSHRQLLSLQIGRFEPSETPPPNPKTQGLAAFGIPLVTSKTRVHTRKRPFQQTLPKHDKKQLEGTANFTVPENKTIPQTLDMPTGLRKFGPHRRGKVGGDFPKRSRGTEQVPQLLGMVA